MLRRWRRRWYVVLRKLNKNKKKYILITIFSVPIAVSVSDLMSCTYHHYTLLNLKLYFKSTLLQHIILFEKFPNSYIIILKYPTSFGELSHQKLNIFVFFNWIEYFKSLNIATPQVCKNVSCLICYYYLFIFRSIVEVRRFITV